MMMKKRRPIVFFCLFVVLWYCDKAINFVSSHEVSSWNISKVALAENFLNNYTSSKFRGSNFLASSGNLLAIQSNIRLVWEVHAKVSEVRSRWGVVEDFRSDVHDRTPEMEDDAKVPAAVVEIMVLDMERSCAIFNIDFHMTTITNMTAAENRRKDVIEVIPVRISRFLE